MTRRFLPLARRAEYRRLPPANIHHVRAARVKATAYRRIGDARHSPFQNKPLSATRRNRNWRRCEQRCCVRVRRLPENLFARAYFDNLSEVHDSDTVADMVNEAQIM